MSFYKNMSIRAKLLSSFFVVIIINTVMLIASITALNYSRYAAERVNEIFTQAFVRITNSQSAVNELNQYYLLGLNPDVSNITAQDVLRDSPAYNNKLRNSVSQIRPDFFNDPEYSKLCIQLRENALASIAIIENEIIPLVRQNNLPQAYRDYSAKVGENIDLALSAGADLIRYQSKVAVDVVEPASKMTTIYIDIVFGVISTIMAIVMAFIISNYISKTIHEQNKILLAIADGDLTKHIPEGHNDELGEARIVLRKMLNSLNKILHMTKLECAKLQNEMQELKESASTVASTSNELQAKSIAVAAATNEMVSTTAEIARNCEHAATGSSSCRESTAISLDMVTKAVENIRQQSEHTRDNAAKIDNLARQSREIGSIVSTIDDIAAQTNLLALNAAIEAARAGSAGRGFAVVADEVRALASRTSSSTQEISRMVKSIQDEAAVATDSINASVSNMETVAQNAIEIEGILNNITNQVNDVNLQITQIATAAEEQTTATGEISANVQMATHATEDVTHRANVQSETMGSAYKDLDILSKSLAFFKTKEV